MTLAEEIRKGNESEFAPYTNYLSSRPTGLIPSFWSDAGQKLLSAVDDGQFAGAELEEGLAIVFGPHSVCSQISDDPIFNLARESVMTRADDDVLTPGYDFTNHQNGGNLNMDHEIVMHQHVIVKALTPIQAGGQIINSYNMCAECGNRLNNGYGTSGKRLSV